MQVLRVTLEVVYYTYNQIHINLFQIKFNLVHTSVRQMLFSG